MKKRVRCSFMFRAVVGVDGWRGNECLRLTILMTGRYVFARLSDAEYCYVYLVVYECEKRRRVDE
jgi:hypothetical protein